MSYVAIESVTKPDGTYAVNTFKKETRDEAEKAYHSILSVAATSKNLIHAATILNPEGKALKSECYKHDPEPEPEPQPEPTPEPTPDPEPEQEPETPAEDEEPKEDGEE